jgi:hypothetical protein
MLRPQGGYGRVGVAIALALLWAGSVRADEKNLTRVEALDRQIVELYRQ